MHVPHDLTWGYEVDDAPKDATRFRKVKDLGELPALVDAIG